MIGVRNRCQVLAALATAALVACQPLEDTPTERVAPDPSINDPYLDPNLNPERLNAGFTRDSREAFAARHDVVAAMALASGDRVADVGCGTGIYVDLFATAVGPTGTVYAQDISGPMLSYVAKLQADKGNTHVQTVLGDTDRTNLPRASLDKIFHSNVYHHFEQALAINEDLYGALVEGGEVYILDYERVPGVSSDWILSHVRMSKETVMEEMEAVGFQFVEEVELDALDENYLLRFRKP